MAEYRLKSNGEVKTESQLRSDNKNMSFPKTWNNNVYEALGVDPVFITPSPTPSADHKLVVRDGVVQDSKGNWVEAWKEIEMFTEYTDDNGDTITVETQKTAYDTQKKNELAKTERAIRDNLLAETDYYALSDVTMSTAMTTYRQALRDIPQQTNFPTIIDCPTKP